MLLELWFIVYLLNLTMWNFVCVCTDPKPQAKRSYHNDDHINTRDDDSTNDGGGETIILGKFLCK